MVIEARTTLKLNPWPYFADDEIEVTAMVLRSGKVNYWTGEQGRLFEKEFAAYCGSAYGVAVANGSVGLDIALHVLGIGSGDEVIVSPRSFFASAGAIALSGATPVFADVDLDSQNITLESISACLSPRTRAILCVHLNGWPCDMATITTLAKQHGLFVIEDCAQAHGAKIDGKFAGTWGDIGVFSFCQDKIMTTAGEGGMILTDDEALWNKIWSFKDHGKSYQRVHATDHPEGFRWLHESVGSNFRMTEVQAAVGRRQLLKLDGWVHTRRMHAAFINSAFAGIDCVRVVTPPANVWHSCYKHYVFVRPGRLAAGWDRDRILREFAEAGIPALSGACPEIYLEKAFAHSASKPARRLPAARELGETSLQFLVHPTLTHEQVTDIVAIASRILTRAQRS